MLFSEEFSITINNSKDDWFDPILLFDTKLFIDPLLVSDAIHPNFTNANKKVQHFFTKAFQLAAGSSPVENDNNYKLLKGMIKFPEVEELCLGYSKTTKGSGSGDGFCKDIVDAIYLSIEMGLSDINRFETLGIFNAGIGRDRISDITANLIKKELIEYTQATCQRHSNIKLGKVIIKNYDYDFKRMRWTNAEVELPINPFNNKGTILVPRRFLVDMPNLSSQAFLDYVWEVKDDEIRSQFNYQIKSEINKEQIVLIARKHFEWLTEFEEYIRSSKGVSRYDLAKDAFGLYNPAVEALRYAQNINGDVSVLNKEDFIKYVNYIIDQFKNFIENEGGHKLLWNDDGKPKREDASQTIFTAIVKQLCKANNIDINKENNLGRGPVDFKFSQGYKNRVCIEVKLAKNTKFILGLQYQLPKYMEVEQVKEGIFLVINLTPEDFTKTQDIHKETEAISQRLKIKIKSYSIDGTRKKISASNIKK